MARVLVIGKDVALVRGLRSHGPLASCEFVAAPSNIETLKAVRARSYEVVVTDPITSVDADLALVEEIRTIRPGVRAIVLASDAQPEDVIAALRARVFAVFTPPFVVGEIAAMIEHAIEQDPGSEGIVLISGLPYWLTVRIASNLVNGERLVRFMTEYRKDLPESERDDLLAAFREMLMNAMEHGAGFDGDKVIQVTAARTGRAIVYPFRDPGTGFDRESVPHSAVSNPPENPIAHLEVRTQLGMRPGGFGILIAKQLVDEMVYNESGNEVLLIKYTD